LFADDADSYQYLAEAIRKHPPQDELKAMMRQRPVSRAASYQQSQCGNRRDPHRLQSLT
jgi:demethylmenaquinone methyltransferase/2-methoxy-6-polyprenyl-1,4-benzoquinol methylase